MFPAPAPLPTDSSFPFHVEVGSHTSILMSESLVGLNVAATRQMAGRFAKFGAGNPGNAGIAPAANVSCRAATDCARVTVACGRASLARLPHWVEDAADEESATTSTRYRIGTVILLESPCYLHATFDMLWDREGISMKTHYRPHYYRLVALLTLAAPVCLLRAQQPARPSVQSAGTESGFAVFQTKCMSCHGNPTMAGRVPDPATLRQLSPEKIYEALTTGPMKTQGSSLADDQKKMLAVFMSGRTFGSAEQGDAKNMPNHCEANPPMSNPTDSPSWNGWSADVTNSRYQTAKGAGLTADQVPHLKLKWAFGYPTGVSAFGQPAVAAGRVFVGSDIGYVYSLDAKTGCVYWSYQAKGNVRGGPSVGAVKGHPGVKYAVFFGDAHANVYAVDAQTGQQLWTRKVDDHFVARITASPKLYDGYLYVPVSSSEEFAAANLDYPCCTSRGSVVKLNASTGEQAWKAYVVPETPKPTRKNSKGVQQYAPAGASVWNSPTIDEKRHAVYFGTGDSETEPAAKMSDAVMAVDIKSGKVLWYYQAQAGDAFLGGCMGPAKTDNCPKV